MHTGPSVVVNKSGFFSSIAKGFFGLLIVVVISAAVLGVFGLRVVDRNVDMVREIVTDTVPEMVGKVPEMLAVAPKLMEALPPLLADGLNDRRAPDYRDQLAVNARLASDDGERHALVVLEVTNEGTETVSLLSMRIVLEDESEMPVSERAVIVATPLMLDDHELRGPILPGSTRKIPVRVYCSGGAVTPVVETTDVRLWNGPFEPEDAPAELEQEAARAG